jgi:tetratricopeptide (TPR) repeat protein
MSPGPDAEAPVGLDDVTMQGLFALGVRLYDHRMFAESGRIMAYLLRHDPARPHFHRALGKALHAQGEYERAIQAYSRAVRLGLPDADVHFFIGQCLVFLRRDDLAVAAFQRCLDLAQAQPRRGRALMERAHALIDRVKALSGAAARRRATSSPSSVGASVPNKKAAP